MATSYSHAKWEINISKQKFESYTRVFPVLEWLNEVQLIHILEDSTLG